MNKIRNERGEVTTDTKEIQRIIGKVLQIPICQQIGQIGMDQFLETFNLPKLNKKESKNLKRQILTSENEAVIKKTPKKQKPWTRWLHR